MIQQIKTYAAIGIMIVMLTMLVLTKLELHSVNTEFSAYKENIHDQIQQAKIDKTRIEAEQNAKYNQSRRDFLDTDRRLRAALERLRNAESVPGNAGLCLAGSCPGSLPGKTENPSRATDPAEIETGIRQTAFYADAMMDTLQCSRLIQFVK